MKYYVLDNFSKDLIQKCQKRYLWNKMYQPFCLKKAIKEKVLALEK